MVKFRSYGEDNVFMIGGASKSWYLEDYVPSRGKWEIKQYSLENFALAGVVGFRQGFIWIFEPIRIKFHEF